MSKRAFHISLTRDDAKRLFGCRDHESLLRFIHELTESESIGNEGQCVSCTSEWRTLHRCLSDGTLEPNGGQFPGNHVFLGGRILSNTDSMIVMLVRPDAVPIVAGWLNELSRNDLRKNYDYLHPLDGHEMPDSTEFDQLWTSMAQIRDFFKRAAQQHNSIVFAEIK